MPQLSDLHWSFSTMNFFLFFLIFSVLFSFNLFFFSFSNYSFKFFYYKMIM